MTQQFEQLVPGARERILMVQEGLIRASEAAKGLPDDFRKMLLAPYRAMLDELYEHELPLARLADDSDLLLHVSGPAAAGTKHRVSLVTRLMTSTRNEVTRLAKWIANDESIRVPAALDMSLVGMAGGSLFVGFSAGEATGEGEATRVAVEAIGIVGRLVAEGADVAAIAHELGDPAARDIAMSAVKHLAPSGSGISEVEIMGRRIHRAVALTTETRRNARSLMSQPVTVANEQIELVGTVRELDLDKDRFELRSIAGTPSEVRCAHVLDEAEVQRYVNKRVRVAGRPEYNARGLVRLLWVDDIEMVSAVIASDDDDE